MTALGNSTRTLYLASQSPRRAQLLQQIGLSFQTIQCAVDETPQPGESPADYVLRLAIAKAGAGAEQCRQLQLPAGPVLGADTSVVCDGQILGKPVDEEDARRMLGLLSGRVHRVMTAVCILGAKQHSASSITEVTF